MFRSFSRSHLPSALVLALLVLAGCTPQEELTGPSADGVSRFRPAASAHASSSVRIVEIVDLGALVADATESLDVNNSEWVVGMVNLPRFRGHPFLWTPEDGLSAIAGLSRAEAINNNGIVTGRSRNTARVWTMTGGTIDLDNSGVDKSSASGINDNDQVVGQVRDGTSLIAAVWNPNEARDFWRLERLASVETDVGEAQDINNMNQVVGVSSVLDGPMRATLWSSPPRTRKDLGDLGGAESEALSINDFVHIVGWSDDASGRQRPFFWMDVASGPDAMVDLGTLGGDEGIAYDVNNAGVVVGATETSPGGPMHATLWTSAGEMVDLGGLPGFTESFAFAINENATVVGKSVVDGVERAIVWRLEYGEASPPNPEEAIDGLEDAVEGRVDAGLLSKGNGRSLLAKLDSADKNLGKGKSKTAANVLGAFINQLNALVKSGKLSDAEAQPLIDLAQAAIDQLNGE